MCAADGTALVPLEPTQQTSLVKLVAEVAGQHTDPLASGEVLQTNHALRLTTLEVLSSRTYLEFA